MARSCLILMSIQNVPHRWNHMFRRNPVKKRKSGFNQQGIFIQIHIFLIQVSFLPYISE
jgi:hypothetical protein